LNIVEGGKETATSKIIKTERNRSTIYKTLYVRKLMLDKKVTGMYGGIEVMSRADCPEFLR
jgi:hypothetical protein